MFPKFTVSLVEQLLERPGYIVYSPRLGVKGQRGERSGVKVSEVKMSEVIKAFFNLFTHKHSIDTSCSIS